MTTLYRIKPLEWEDLHPLYIAKTPISDFSILCALNGKVFLRPHLFLREPIQCESFDAAKQKAEELNRELVEQLLEPAGKSHEK